MESSEDKSTTFIIGRDMKQCNQPFSIVNMGVSRVHAKVTISEFGEWTLEDMGSDNGTYILNRRGRWVAVKNPIRITEDTIIRLGEEYGYGVRFMAHRLTVKDQNDYRYEFGALKINNEHLDKERKRLKNWELVRIGLLVVAVGIAFIPDSLINNAYVNNIIDRMSILIPTLVACWIGWQGKRDRERLDQKQEAYSVCPNPSCNYQLDKNSQKRLECPRCKSKFVYTPKRATFDTKTK